jgi:hypothetical protein
LLGFILEILLNLRSKTMAVELKLAVLQKRNEEMEKKEMHKVRAGADLCDTECDTECEGPDPALSAKARSGINMNRNCPCASPWVAIGLWWPWI